MDAAGFPGNGCTGISDKGENHERINRYPDHRTDQEI